MTGVYSKLKARPKQKRGHWTMCKAKSFWFLVQQAKKILECLQNLTFSSKFSPDQSFSDNLDTALDSPLKLAFLSDQNLPVNSNKWRVLAQRKQKVADRA